MKLGSNSMLRLPEVRIVDKIPHGSHPVGRFTSTSSPQQIEFSRAECYKLLSREALLYVIYHELGHWFRTNCIRLEDIMGWSQDEGFLIFGNINSEEGFADAFAAFLMGDPDFEARYPEQHALLANMLNNFKEELRDFCDSTCKWLAKQLQEETT